MTGMRAALMALLLIGCHASRDATDVIAAHGALERRIEAAPSAAPRPWAVGQWTLYKISDGKTVGYSKHAVVAVGSCGTWIENIYVKDKYADRLTLKACFKELEPGPINDDLDNIQAVMSRRGGPTVVVDFRNGKNPRTKELMKQMIASFITLAWQSAPVTEQQELVVPAGHFVGSQKIVTTAWIEQSLHRADVWTHPDVPLGGAIKVVGDTGTESVLLDYGLSGASGDLPDFDEQLENSVAQ
jgi:hypothetical protein